MREKVFMSESIGQSGSSRRSFLKSMAGTVGAMAMDVPGIQARIVPASPQRRSNLVFFLGEGVRSDEFSFAGNKIIHTPNFDRLASEGMSFRNSFCTDAL